MYQYFFCGGITIHCMDKPHLIYPFVNQNWGCFYFLAVLNNDSVNIHVQVFVQACIFIYLGYSPTSEISGA